MESFETSRLVLCLELHYVETPELRSSLASAQCSPLSSSSQVVVVVDGGRRDENVSKLTSVYVRCVTLQLNEYIKIFEEELMTQFTPIHTFHQPTFEGHMRDLLEQEYEPDEVQVSVRPAPHA